MGMGRWQAGGDLREHSVPRSYVCWYSDWQWRREKGHFKSRRKQVIAEHLVIVLCIPGKSFNCPIPREALKITGKYLI